MGELNLVIAIYDSDKTYLDRLSAYLMTYQGCKFSIKKYSSFNEGNMNGILQADVIIASEAFISSFEHLKDSAVVILLAEDFIEVSHSAYNIVKKYQPGKNIAEGILQHYLFKAKKEAAVNTGRNTKVISFLSPVGGCGKTTISLVLAGLLARQQHMVLYISLDLSAALRGSKNEGLSELMYYVKMNSGNLLMKFEGIKDRDEVLGVDFLQPFHFNKELMEISDGDWDCLMGSLIRYGKYDYILLDISTGCLEQKMLLHHCSNILLVTNYSQFSHSKLSQFIAVSDQELLGKITIVKNQNHPLREDFREDEYYGLKGCYLPYGEDVFMKEDKEKKINQNSVLFKACLSLVDEVKHGQSNL